MNRAIFLMPFIITFSLLSFSYLNGAGCDFKIKRKIQDEHSDAISEEFGVCRDGRINFIITEGSTKSQWTLSGRYLSIGKQMYIIFDSRRHVQKKINTNSSQLDKEMNVSSEIYIYNYAMLPLSYKKLALFEKTPTNQILLYELDGEIDLWDIVFGYKHIL